MIINRQPIYDIFKKGFIRDFIGLGLDIKKAEPYKKSAVKYAKKYLGVKLQNNYKLSNLSNLDQIVKKLHTTFLKNLQQSTIVVGSGFYLGEIIINNIGNWWVPWLFNGFGRNYPKAPFIVRKGSMYWNPMEKIIDLIENNQAATEWYNEILKEVESQKSIRGYGIGKLTKKQSDDLLDFLLDIQCDEFFYTSVFYDEDSSEYHKTMRFETISSQYETKYRYIFDNKTKEFLKSEMKVGLLPNVFKRENFLEDFIFFRNEKIVFLAISHNEEGGLYLTDQELENFKNLGIEYTPFVFNRKKPTVRKKKWYEGILKLSGRPMR